MKRYDQIYRYISIANAVLHALLVVFLVIVGFWPFYENQNYYQVFGGALTPYLYLLMPIAAAVFAALAVKRPLWSLATAAFTFWFFFTIIFSYTVETMIVDFSSPWTGSSMGLWQQGFTVMCHAVNILLWDIAFVIYAIVTVIVRATYSRKQSSPAYIPDATTCEFVGSHQPSHR